MEIKYWQERWDKKNITFHEGKPNTLLTRYFSELNLPQGARIFVPLCGKTQDIPWLMAQGYKVVGVEVVETAVIQLFDELRLNPSIVEKRHFKIYQAPGLDVLVGDIFNLTAHILGHVDGIYDRAALVALPPLMRENYAKLLSALASNAPQLAITFEYDQSLMPGPPFSIGRKDIEHLYHPTYSHKHLEELDVKGGVKGICPAKEHAWLLQPRQS